MLKGFKIEVNQLDGGASEHDIDGARAFFRLFYVKRNDIAGFQFRELNTLQTALMEENVFGTIFRSDKAKVLFHHQGFNSTFHIG